MTTLTIIHAVVVITITITFTIFSALIDAEHINKDEYITNHKHRWFQRATFFTALGLINPIFILASALIFSFIFDQLLNFLRNKPLLYLGTVSEWDRFFKDKIELYIAFKILCLLVALYLLFYLN